MTDPKPFTAEELARLRSVADAATDGPWMAHPPNGFGDIRISTGQGDCICDLGDPEDAAHIAAFDPPTVLRLLDMVERQRDALGDFIVATATAVSDEREACAKVAEEGLPVCGCSRCTMLRQVAAKIRARGDQ